MEKTINRLKVKICGLTRIEDADFLNEAGADYAGFVFYEKSRRNVSLKKAAEIAAHLSADIKKVAVTVSLERAFVKEIETLGFDILQVHGTLKTEVKEMTALPIWRAVNISDTDTLEELFAGNQESIEGYVADGAGYGGGKPFDWEVCSSRVRALSKGKKLILAGGLDAENVRTGIRYFHPDVVDVSSSVEEDGKKSRQKIEEFIRKVRKNEQ